MKATILLEPVAKGRARVFRRGDHVGSYTPAKTKNAEQMIVYALRQELTTASQFDKATPLRLEVTFYRSRPKSAPKKVTMPVTRPDLDNYLKLILDAISGYLCPDDSQVTTILAKKRFTEDVPRIELALEKDE